MSNQARPEANATNPLYVRILVPLIWFSLVPLLFLVTALLESPAEKVGSETRKCRSSLNMHLLADADGYCGKALRLTAEEGITNSVAAEAYAQSAVLAVLRKQYKLAADHCRMAIPLWRDDSKQADPAGAAQRIDECAALIADVEQGVVPTPPGMGASGVVTAPCGGTRASPRPCRRDAPR